MRVEDREIHARHIISSIGAREMFDRLVPEGHRPQHATRIVDMPPSCSISTLYLPLKRDIISQNDLAVVN